MTSIDSKKRNLLMTPFSRDQRKCLSGIVGNDIIAYKTTDTLAPSGVSSFISDQELSVYLEANIYYRIQYNFYLSVDTAGGIAIAFQGGNNLLSVEFFKGVGKFNYTLSPEVQNNNKITDINSVISSGLSGDINAQAYLCETSVTALVSTPVNIIPMYHVSAGITPRSTFVLMGSNVIATPLDFINTVT